MTSPRRSPPVAARRSTTRVVHGVTLQDPYHWLKDPNYPEVAEPDILHYLRAENDYFDAEMAPYRKLIDTLFEELKSRQPEEDQSVPYQRGDYWYRWRFEPGAQYRTWERAPIDDPETWSVMLDETTLARGLEYFSLGGLSVSPDGRYLAWSADTDGSERFQLSITDLSNGAVVDEPITNSQGSPVWSADGQHFYYLQLSDNWRPYQVRLHRLGSSPNDDRIVYEEQDESFFVGVSDTQSEAWIVITTGDHVTSEAHLIPADDPHADLRLVAARRAGIEYHLDHRAGRFYVLTNDEHRNFRLAVTADDRPEPEHWHTLIGGSRTRYLTDVLCLKDWLVVSERVDGLDQICVIPDPDSGMEGAYYIEFPEPVHDVGFGTNLQYEQTVLRLYYQSMVTPVTIYDFDLRSRSLTTRKMQKIPSGYDPGAYTAERLLVTARDGAEVPVSLVRRRDVQPSPTTPLHLYGYGAYGMRVEPEFSASRLSLLDRGFIYAIAHIRGGDDLGYHWYEDGKLDKRTNTFNDFVDVSRHLIEAGYTGLGRITISGGSAGGELMGAVVNQAAELYGAVAAHVPFMDVLNTMLDPDLPLTPIEWPEWGNPIEDPEAFELIRSYSPYDNLRRRDYPPMLVTAGLNDPRVTYWEPAKYVASIRHLKTDTNWLLLKTNMGAGHRGQSGRFDALMEVAEEYAFLLISLGLETAAA
ncbi:MAG TPA: S9 family peptidase [Pseudomonadales bacterium]